MLHELIDKDEPKCLYCNSDFDYDIKSEWRVNSQSKDDREILTCRKCKEVFHIHSEQSDDGVTFYLGFLFSCNGIFVYSHYNTETFFLGKDAKVYATVALYHNPTRIPSFIPDFSDKKKLHEKLKTYLIFS
jgi:hypothetical protein